MPLDREKIGRALAGFGAGVAGRGTQFLESQETQRRLLDEERSQAVLEDAFTIQRLLTPGPNQNVPEAQNVALARIDALRQLDGGNADFSDSLGLLNKMDAGDIEGALRDVNTVVDFGIRTERLTDPSARDANLQFGAGKKVLGTTAAGKVINGTVTQRKDPNTGSIVSEFVPDVGAVDPNDPVVSTQNVGTLGLTGQQQIDERQADRVELARVQTQETKKREVSKLKVKREQTFIDEAISVGDSLPEMKRARELLLSIKTGGFKAAAIRAKQLFGIESADEGELASKLGVAVMSRLRQTFGAQFTEREGDRLDRASARMGANTATNIRLLDTTIARMEREMNRGLRFATNFEDQDAMDLINDALLFTFDQAPAAPAAAGTVPGQESIEDILARNSGG